MRVEYLEADGCEGVGVLFEIIFDGFEDGCQLGQGGDRLGLNVSEDNHFINHRRISPF